MPGAAVPPRGSARRGTRARPSSRRPRDGPRPSRPTRGCGAGSRPRRRRGRVADEPVLVGQGEVDQWAASLRAGRRPVAPAAGPGSIYSADGHRRRPPALDLAALAAPNLSPVLGRYFTAAGATGSAIGSTTPTAAATSTSPTGSRSRRSGHVHPRVTAAIHAQVDKLDRAGQRDRASREPISRLADDARRRRSRRRSTRSCS